MSDTVGTSDGVWSSADLDVHLYARHYERYRGAYEHQDELCIYLCTGGGGRLVRHSSGQRLDGLFLPGTVGVGSHEDGGEGFWPDMRLIGLCIEPPRLAKLLDELPPRSFDLEAIASTFHQNTLLAAVIQELWTQARLHAYSKAFLDHGLAVAIHQLVRGLQPVKARQNIIPFSKFELGNLIGFLDGHLGDDIAIERMARIVGLSPNHFSHRFRATTGLAPYQFITRRRLDRAADLLLSTQVPVAQIGAMIGYANPSHFSAAFRRYKGTTPAAWRRARTAAFGQVQT